REGDKGHAGIATGDGQHLLIGWPGFFVLSTADQQQLPPVKPVMFVEPKRRIVFSNGWVAVEQVSSRMVGDWREVPAKLHSGLKFLWLAEQQLSGTERAGAPPCQGP